MKYFETIPSTRLQRWNRRQRKKLRLGEFRQLGFTLFLNFSAPLDDDAYQPFWDDLIGQIEALGLCVGGLGGSLPLTETEGFIAAEGNASVSPEQQASLLAWCSARPEVRQARAGELVDAWHGWGPL